MRSKKHELGELRQDAITEKWVVVAAERAKRPDGFASGQAKASDLPKYKDDCPFCNLVKFPQEPDILRLPDDPDRWQVHIFSNKYPAFRPQDEFRTWNEGPHRATEAVGYHEVLATRYHNQFDGLLSITMLSLVFEALILRYRQLRTKPSVNYIQIIKNQGQEAGGSLEHPHHQIFTVPVLPSDIGDLLHGVQRFADKHNAKAFTIILGHERSEKTRVVWENELFTAFCPFASRVPFEVWVMPRKSNPFFDSIGPEEREALAEVMQQVLGRLYTGLNDPPYNYYILSAPCDETCFICDKSLFPNFRWHIEVLPRLSKFGGFELGTGLEINTTLPEEAAAYLREQSLPSPVL
jgi:UDPglucose--hexose-1-phosphate uridylyltransferase